jgi:hypothetical protein
VKSDCNDLDLAPLDPRTLCNAADTVDTAATAAADQDCHHVDHCGLQVFELLLSSDSESEEEFDASVFNDCDGF